MCVREREREREQWLTPRGDRHVAERTSYVWRVNYFDRWSRHIFSPNGDDEFHSARMTCPGKSISVKARQTFSSSKSCERDGRISVLSLPSGRIITSWGEPSGLWTLESNLQNQGFPIGYKLDVSILPFRGKLFFTPKIHGTTNYWQEAKCML